MAYVIARGYENAETPEEFRSGSITNVVADSLSIAGVLLAILVVRVASDRLDAKAAAVPPPAPPAPEGDFSVPERPAGVPA